MAYQKARRATAMLLATAWLCTGCLMETAAPESTPKDPVAAVQEYAQQTDNALYLAKANEYITLRKAPSTGAEEIERVPAGDRLLCLGFDGTFMKVKVQKTGSVGYVNGGYVERSTKDTTLADLTVVKTNSAEYTYDRMQSDLRALSSKYPNLLTIKSLGKTADSRDITLCIVGNKNAAKKVFVTASIHAREYMTSMLVMKLLERQLFDMKKGGVGDVAFYIVPMLNPDGVTISQSGAAGIRDKQLRANVETILQRDNIQAELWKSNARGVDLNRNFDANWDTLNDDGPSALRYRGDAPFSEAETQAVKKLVEENAFSATVSYHESGSVIYWRYEQSAAVLVKSQTLAQNFSALSGYPLSTDEEEEGLEGGGLKDWALMKKGIPSLTIEVGCLEAPLALNEWAAIWQRNRDILRILAAFANAK